jgi:hypothetical protein
MLFHLFYGLVGNIETESKHTTSQQSLMERNKVGEKENTQISTLKDPTLDPMVVLTTNVMKEQGRCRTYSFSASASHNQS